MGSSALWRTAEAAAARSAAGPNLPLLLRTWRLRAGEQLGRGRPLSQAEVAEEVGVSERWYRDMERGVPVRLSQPVLERLSQALLLGKDEHLALHYVVAGGAPSWGGEKPSETRELQGLVDRQMPHPAYCSDSAWQVVVCNRAMAEWFPWMTEPGANLMRWVLTTEQAREQLLDWSENAGDCLAQVRFALARNPECHALRALADEVLNDPHCRELWEQEPRVVAFRDGHHFRLRLPRFGGEAIRVVSQVLIPANRQDHRFVVITRTDSRA